ncbi:hypothetical protein ACGFW5_26095 [Streptomyces sp. NPDC048416]|uniref:hypothetical protein n=1 Tax=Streptomyces sp. NPDC048416 TaxID=3365546 RepID=UPI0037168A73
MGAYTDTTTPVPQARGLQPPTCGVLFPARAARADRGFARAAGTVAVRTPSADRGSRIEDRDDGDGGGEDAQQ